MNGGYIKLFRQILDNPTVCKDAEYFAVWVYILLKATHTGRQHLFRGKRITLKPGQFTTARSLIAHDLHISESKVQRILTTFKNERQIEQQTSSEKSLITVLNWDMYQNSEQRNEQQVNGGRTASERRLNTQQECKKGKNEKDNIYIPDNITAYVEVYNSICTKLPKMLKLTDKRKKAIGTFSKEFSLDEFKIICWSLNNDSFYTGENDRGWKADFDYIMRTDKASKFLEKQDAAGNTQDDWSRIDFAAAGLERMAPEQARLLFPGEKRNRYKELFARNDIDMEMAGRVRA